MARDLKRAYSSCGGGGGVGGGGGGGLGMGGSCAAAASVLPSSVCYDLLAARNGDMKGVAVVDDNAHGLLQLPSSFSSNLKAAAADKPSSVAASVAAAAAAVAAVAASGAGSYASFHNNLRSQQQAHEAPPHQQQQQLTESSVLISNNGTSSSCHNGGTAGGGGGGGSETVNKGHAAARCADDWWVESWAPSTIAAPHQASPPPHAPPSLEHNLMTCSSSSAAAAAVAEFGAFKNPGGYGNYEDFDSMLFTLPGPEPDQNVMKCLMGESQTVSLLQHQGLQALHQQGGGGGGQRIQYADAVMMEQDSWSSSHEQQQQSAQSEISHHHHQHQHHQLAAGGSTGDAFSSVSPSSPSRIAAISEPTSFLTPSFSSLPRALSLPSHMRNITINSAEQQRPSSDASTVRLSINGPSGYPFTLPSSSMAAAAAAAAAAAYSDSPDSSSSPVPGDLFQQSLLSHASSGFPALQPPQESGSFVAPSSIHGGQMPSSSSLNHGFHVNHHPPSLIQGSCFYTASQDSRDFTPHHHQHHHHHHHPHPSLQRSFSSLPTLTSMDHQPMKLQGMGTANQDYLLQRQRSWQPGWSPSRHFGSSSDPRNQKVAAESRIRTGGALSPLSSSVPGFTTLSSSSGGGSLKLENFGERKDGLGNLDTGQQQQQQEGRVIPEAGGGLTMKTYLLSAAKAVEVGNTEMAQAILARLNQHISPTRGKPFHRLAHYFTQALVTRIMGAENFTEQLLPDRILPPLEEYRKINAYVRFCEVSPFPKFAHFTANQAIMEALEGENSVHVIDFRLGAGAQWASFIQDIASTQASGKSSTPTTVRLTAIGSNCNEMHATGASLCAFAQLLNVLLEFQAVVTSSPELLELSMLNLRDQEAVAVNFVFSLHRLLDGTFSNRLNAVLKTVREARPKVITVVEQEANHSGSNFQERFSEAFQYYFFLFDSLTSSSLEQGGLDSSVNIENYLLAPEILNIVACEGASRVERHEQLEQWRIRLCKAGFQSRPLSDTSQFQADKLVNDLCARRGFQVARDNGCLLLCWQGRPLLAASSWTCC